MKCCQETWAPQEELDDGVVAFLRGDEEGRGLGHFCVFFFRGVLGGFSLGLRVLSLWWLFLDLHFGGLGFRLDVF